MVSICCFFGRDKLFYCFGEDIFGFVDVLSFYYILVVVLNILEGLYLYNVLIVG